VLISCSALFHSELNAKDLYTSNRCIVKKAENLEELPPPALTLFWSGECLNSYTNGNGTLKATTGDHVIFIYEGNMTDGVFSGQGYIQWPSIHTSYKGEWTNGDITGKGVFKDDDGSVYTGHFKKGVADGRGRKRWPDTKNSYDGDWKNGKMQGKGTFKYGNGDIYEGEISNDLFSGKGKLTWSDGTYYVGTFKNDLAHGKGTLHHTDGTSETVNYINGKIQRPSPAEDKPAKEIAQTGREDYPCEPFIRVARGSQIYEMYYTPYGARVQGRLETTGANTDSEARRLVKQWKEEGWPDARREEIIKDRTKLLAGLRDTLNNIMRGGPDENWYQQYIYMLTCYQEAGWPEDLKYRRCSIHQPGKLGYMNGNCIPI